MNKILSLGVLVTCGAISSVVIYENLKPQPSCACASEAKTYIGSMNRLQQALYIETGRFAKTFDTLTTEGLLLKDETESYRYTVEPGDGAVFHYAQPLKHLSNLFYGYVGGVFAKRDENDETWMRTYSLICIADQPGEQTLVHPIDENTCAPGTSLAD